MQIARHKVLFFVYEECVFSLMERHHYGGNLRHFKSQKHSLRIHF